MDLENYENYEEEFEGGDEMEDADEDLPDDADVCFSQHSGNQIFASY